MRLVAFAIMLVAGSAHAQPMMSAEARVHFDRGRALYDAGSYDEAIVELTAGHDLDPNPDFLYALGQAYRKLGDCAHAVASYRAFLATQPPEGEAAKVRANIARCPVTPPSVTSAPSPSEPVQIPERTPATPSRTDAPRSRTDEPAHRRPFYTDTTGDLLAAGGLAGLGVGVTYLVLGDRDTRAANAAPTIARLQELSATAGHERTIGVICTIAGGAFTAGAIVRYVMASRRDPGLSIALTPGSVSVVWSGRF
jgi:tetratricopeptide (TPR) repeat protein